MYASVCGNPGFRHATESQFRGEFRAQLLHNCRAGSKPRPPDAHDRATCGQTAYFLDLLIKASILSL